MGAEDERRMTPLMLSNKRAVVRINNMIDSVFGDIVSSGTGAYDIKVGDGFLLAHNVGLMTLHTASGNANNGVSVKAVNGGVLVETKPGQMIDDRSGGFYVKSRNAIHFKADGSNWWVI